MADFTPDIGPDVNIFQEIGLGKDVGAAGGNGDGGTEGIVSAIQSGSTADLIKAQKQLNDLVAQRTQAAKPFPQAPDATPRPKPAQPTPAPAPTPPPAPATQAPKPPQSGQPQGQEKSVLADLATVIRETAKIGQPLQEAQRPSQNVGVTQTPSPVTGRKPL